MITPEELAGMKERLAEATPGPWFNDGDAEWYTEGEGYGAEWFGRTENECIHIYHDDTGSGRCQSAADATFIAHARTDMERLIAEVERLQKRNEWLDTELSVARSTLEMIND